MPNEFSFNEDPGSLFCFPDMYKSIIQGTWIHWINPDAAYNFSWVNTPSAQNDELEYELYSPGGNKTFEVLCFKGPDQADMWVYLDDVYQGKIPLYKPAPYAFHQRLTLPVAVLSTGKHSIKLKAASRDPESSGWAFSFHWIRIY